MFDLSNDQKIVLKKLLEWYKPDTELNPKYVTLGGYAGTGKTTLISILRRELYNKYKTIKVSFCSYTGKGAIVLKNKLIDQKAIYSQDTVSTIHSLIYSPDVNSNDEIIGWKLKDKIDCDLIIIDEASMVDAEIWRDLTSFNIPIIAVGDHGQLPPIVENFNLMQKPMLLLNEIHRQAKNNPIIQLSIQARENGIIKEGIYHDNIKKLLRKNAETGDLVEELLSNYDPNTLVLCGYNNTRVRLNQYIRQKLGFENPEPDYKDRVICLRNNHEKEIYNGMIGTIILIDRQDEDWYNVQIEMDGIKEPYSGLISIQQFNNPQSLNYTKDRRQIMGGDLFDFGYATTVHKAQGSEAHRVIVFEERFKQMDDEKWKRWLYTAVTRAQHELFIIG